MSDKEATFVLVGVGGGLLTAVGGFFAGRPGIGVLALAFAIALFLYGGWRLEKAERERDAANRAEKRLAEYRAQQARSAIVTGVVIVARPLPPPVVVIAPAPPPLPRPFQFDTPEQMEARFLAFLAKPVAAEKPVIPPAARKPVARTVRVTRTTVTITSQERRG